MIVEQKNTDQIMYPGLICIVLSSVEVYKLHILWYGYHSNGYKKMFNSYQALTKLDNLSPTQKCTIQV